MKIVFDLDGTLICSKKRLYSLFCFLVGGNQLTFEQYWHLKFFGKTNQQILIDVFGYSNVMIEKFIAEWMTLIESEYYLKMDTIIAGVPDLLSFLKKEHALFLCTARQSTEKTNEQLENLSIAKFFEKVFVTNQSTTKERLLKDGGITFTKEDWIVGDTGHDILTGKSLGLKTCAVLSGFMSEEKLKKYEPDIILKNATNFLEENHYV